MRMRLTILVLSALCAAACDTSIDPFQESGAYFSIGGIIDASADTQFVRISPLRRSALPPSGNLEAVVESVDLQTGEVSVWRDSLFQTITSGPVHNFWSTYDFEPGGRYRLTVTSAEGNASLVEVALPDTFPDPVVQQTLTDPIPTLNVYVDRLADLRVLYCGTGVSGVPQRFDAVLTRKVSEFGQGFTIRFDPFSLARELRVGEILWMRIFAAAASPDWPPFEEIDDETLAHPHTVKNVENGVGFVGGVTSKLVDWPNFTPLHPDCVTLLRSL